MGIGTKPFKLFSIGAHHEAVQRMSVMVHDVAHDLECSHFRDLATIQGLLEGRKEVEDSDWLRDAEAATLHFVPDAAVPLAIVVRDIWSRRRGRIVQPISPVVDYLGKTFVAREDRSESWYWWTKIAVWPYDFGV